MAIATVVLIGYVLLASFVALPKVWLFHIAGIPVWAIWLATLALHTRWRTGLFTVVAKALDSDVGLKKIYERHETWSMDKRLFYLEKRVAHLERTGKALEDPENYAVVTNYDAGVW